MKQKVLYYSALAASFLNPAAAMATVLAPNPEQSNQTHWDSILGSGSFESYSTVMRAIPCILLLIVSAWAIFGLFRAAFIDESIKPFDFILYAGRLMLIVTISITLIVNGKS